ncbi:MAG: monophosphatase [Solirubrobacteraceae bacterium]|jgi:myo-inositol-1(or 4)-monophosphatase|nr:monophosphatase [Solirubrobacteraceae bacterium]
MTGDVELAARAVHAGAEAALAVVREGALDVRTKEAPTDLVSAADTAAEAAIARVLRAERPDDALLGEEGAREHADSARRWLIDGIDGTFNFVSGIPHWCVAVGLEEDGAAAVGAVYDPSADELFVAGPGHPTTVNAAPATVRTGRTLEQAAVATYLPPTAADAAATLGRLAEPVGVLRTGGAGTLELAWVAAGRVDGWAQPDVAPWDWLPGAALVRHAGGTATVLDGEPAWHLAGTPALVAELAAIVPRA